MRGYVTDSGAPAGLRLADDLPEPEQPADALLVDVRAFAVNRGELFLLQQRPDGWRPGQDLAGVVVSAAADGSGPPAGSRVVGVVDGTPGPNESQSRSDRRRSSPIRSASSRPPRSRSRD